MPSYRCQTCGKTFDAEKNEICPKCGTAVAPSVLTRVERKQTAARLRAEGMFHYDDHCHEDDAWKDSYGAQAHRAAVRSHEANLRAGYNAHSAYDVTNRGANAVQNRGTAAQQFRPAAGTQETRNQSANKQNAVWRFLLPFIIFLVWVLFNILRSALKALG